MKKVFMLLLMVAGMVLHTIPVTVYAEDIPIPTPEPYRGEIDVAADQYLNFGNAKYPADDPYGIEINVDIESTATYWIDVYFEVTPDVINSRKIDKFYVLANGKVIDQIFVQWQDADDNGMPDPIGYYKTKPESWGLAGGDVIFQIVGVSMSRTTVPIGSENQKVESIVAWSAPSQLVSMDPVKVNDAEAIGVLRSILAKLGEMQTALTGKLQQIREELQTLFTPTPEAEQRLSNAMDSLWKATPMSEIADQANEMKSMFENTPLSEPMEELTFGEKRDWFGIGKEFYLFDLTEVQEQIKLIRALLSAVVWIEFFVWLVFYLSPKLSL